MDIKKIKSEVKTFWKKNEPKIVLVLGFCLISALSFEAGILLGNKAENQPIIIEKTIESQVAGAEANNAPAAQKTPQAASVDSINASAVPQNCALVGSKNSDKYHLPTCSYAKRIKPENVVCFKDKNEAESKGYVADKSCIK